MLSAHAQPSAAAPEPLTLARSVSSRPSRMSISALAGLVATLALGTGCLSDSYRIPDAELQRLASLPPEQRGAAVRVVQRTSFSEEVAEQPVAAAPAPGPGVVMFIGGPVIPIGGGPVGGPVAPGAGFAGAPVRGAPVGGGGTSPRGNLPSKVSGDKDTAILLAVAAVAFTVGSIATEGARFDGTAAVHPAHAVHLVYPGGAQRITTLWELAPQDTVNVSEAVLSQKEGPIVEGERAPLDRQGFAWRLDAGLVGNTLPTGEHVGGPGMNLGLGYFPLPWFGLLLASQVGGGTLDGRNVLDVRLGLEANAFPLALGRLHLGGYGQITNAWLEADTAQGSGETISRQTWSASAGGLLELGLTTRLALVGRVGETFDGAVNGKTPHALSATLGFSVY